ncbi:hypothetical protein Sjap_023967 [Stephania japonica]|uniref:DNA2/NAM7 helicase-like C-terminal domain-containing protein n=1 Tax=Stephania japonica TaxID=461633 RepID=A0AAP0ECL5_9MAGN
MGPRGGSGLDVISPIAERFGYGMSLFKRFQRAGYPVQMLKTQYRMHPAVEYLIRSFPSKEFYSEALEDGADVRDQTERSWHWYRCFGPFCFFDVEGLESQPSGSGSWVNVDEVEIILLMYNKLVTSYPELKSSSRVAIISPYRYQGREMDVAIFSCVRASQDKGIGFVADFRRMNISATSVGIRVCFSVIGEIMPPKRNQQRIEEVYDRDNLNRQIGQLIDQRMGAVVEQLTARIDQLLGQNMNRIRNHRKEPVDDEPVSKPYASFFSSENLETMNVKKAKMVEAVGQLMDEMESDAAAMYENPVEERT